jgi:hypothetical protein
MFLGAVVHFVVLFGRIQAFAFPSTHAGAASQWNLRNLALFESATHEGPEFPKTRRKQAATFFSHPYFYGGDSKSAALDADARKTLFGKRSALDVLENGIDDIRDSTIDFAEIRSYFSDFHHTQNAPTKRRAGSGQGDSSAKSKASNSDLTKGHGGGPLPKYEPSELAWIVFSNPIFYDGDNESAVFHSKKRRNVLNNKTVRELREDVLDRKTTFDKMAIAIRAIPTSIVSRYFATADIEDRLNGKIIPLNSFEEVKTFTERFVPLDSLDLKFGRNDLLSGRSNPLCFVMGPSGSGKTFASLYYFARYAFDGKAKYVTIYLQPPQLDSFTPSNLTSYIKKKIEETMETPFEFLKMGVCVVIDEAGDGALRGFFEDRDHLGAVIDGVRGFAEDVLLVVSGTGITGGIFLSKVDAFKFTLSQWGEEEFLSVIQSDKYVLVGDRLLIAKAIFAHPTLNGLTTHARAAGFLVDSVVRMSAGMRLPVSWWQRLKDWAPAIIDTVVSRFIAAHAIQSLSAPAQLRVAAWVFGVLDLTTRGSVVFPRFDGLVLKERLVASSLLFQNVAREQKEFVWVDGDADAFPASVSPAVSIVLFSIAGVHTRVSVGWRTQGEVSTLYLVREWILLQFRSHHEHEIMPLLGQWAARKNCDIEHIETNLDDYGRMMYGRDLARIGDKFSAVLMQLHLIRLESKIEAVKDRDMLIPKVCRNCIWKNGDGAFFAGIVGPYRLVHAKYLEIKKHGTDEDVVSIYVVKETMKCGLLREAAPRRFALLRALHMIWGGEFDNDSLYSSTNEAVRRKVKISDLQESKAFPENCLDTALSDDPVLCLPVVEKDGNWEIVKDDNTRIVIPEFDDDDLPELVDFVLSTNAKTIQLHLDQRVTISVTDDMLAEDGSLNLRDGKDAKKWESFRGKLRKNVRIKFLFTGYRR